MTPTTIDLRSDTVTRPTHAMRTAMSAAEVGDDVYAEDPTLNALEAAAATRLGKEAALFVPSGTMANLVALLTHCQPGDEVLLGDQAHIVRAEVGGAARLGGLLLTTLPNAADGTMDPASIRAAARNANLHHPPTTLLALENTQNFCGGAVLTREQTEAQTAVATDLGLRTHLDGARIFNAQVATGTPAADLVATVHSASFCLSKGLSCPVGSLLCGDAEFIGRARRTRKLLGGGMRQAGILAAAGLVALDTMIDRLANDHRNARRLAAGLAERGFAIDPETVQSNIVALPLDDAPAWRDRLAQQGVRVSVLSPTTGRLVTHADLSEAHIDEALERIGQAGPVPV
ncbi:MAG: threonine aldolase [Chloroflexi bacterium]|nr:MAG: threonine aldolase [Chloroflexota bacterium]